MHVIEVNRNFALLLHVIQSFKHIERFRMWSYEGFGVNWILFHFPSARNHFHTAIDLRRRHSRAISRRQLCVAAMKEDGFLIHHFVRYWFHFACATYKPRILTSFVSLCKIWISYLAVISWFVSLVEWKKWIKRNGSVERGYVGGGGERNANETVLW